MHIVLGFIAFIVIMTYFAEQGGIVNSTDLETNVFRAFQEEDTRNGETLRETQSNTRDAVDDAKLRALEAEVQALEREINRLQAN